MRLKFLVTTILVSLFAITGYSQVSNDSMNLLKQRQEVLALEKKITDQKLKLATLENKVEGKEKSQRDAAEDAQKSADYNSQIASKLNNDATDRKLSKKARKAARKAEKEAKSARKATSSLEGLNSDIESLKKKIASDEEKLQTLKN